MICPEAASGPKRRRGAVGRHASPDDAKARKRESTRLRPLFLGFVGKGDIVAICTEHHLQYENIRNWMHDRTHLNDFNARIISCLIP